MAREDGLELLGVQAVLKMMASRCPKRGRFADEDGQPDDVATIAALCRIKHETIEHALSILTTEIPGVFLGAGRISRPAGTPSQEPGESTATVGSVAVTPEHAGKSTGLQDRQDKQYTTATDRTPSVAAAGRIEKSEWKEARQFADDLRRACWPNQALSKLSPQRLVWIMRVAVLGHRLGNGFVLPTLAAVRSSRSRIDDPIICQQDPGEPGGIQGEVIFDGGAYGSSIKVLDGLETTGRTVHLTQNSVGALPGDDLFPSGGSLEFFNATSLSLTLGTGADTVYVVPNLMTPITIDGNGPAGAGSGAGGSGAGGDAGDFLGFAFAGVTNPVFTPNGAGGGSYTFDAAAQLTYSHMETTEIDDVRPYIVAQSYDDSAVPTIFVQFSEDVSNSLNVGYLYVFNATTNEELSNGVMDLAYDTSTNTASFTFPGYVNGTLPAGDYTAKIYGSLPDLFGNVMGVETPLTFTIATPAPQLLGDYNLNGEVDTTDYIVWRMTLGNAVTTYSGADGNGDGTIGPEDYDVWRGNFGNTLPALAAGKDASAVKEQTRTESARTSVISSDPTTGIATPETSLFDSTSIARQSRTAFGSESKIVNLESAFASVFGSTPKSSTCSVL